MNNGCTNSEAISQTIFIFASLLQIANFVKSHHQFSSQSEKYLIRSITDFILLQIKRIALCYLYAQFHLDSSSPRSRMEIGSTPC